MKGIVKWFNVTKGYGFINDVEKNVDIFVHISEVEKAGLRGLNEGQEIYFDEQEKNGKISACNLKLQSE
jgi:CspA family cold shock protein